MCSSRLKKMVCIMTSRGVMSRYEKLSADQIRGILCSLRGYVEFVLRSWTRSLCSRSSLEYSEKEPALQCRSVTSQIFNLERYTLDHHCISYFIAFWLDPKNYTQLKEPRRELGISLFSYLSFSQILKIGSFDFNYFIFNNINYKNMREGIK